MLDRALGPAVNARRLKRCILGQRQSSRLAIDCRRRAEYQCLYRCGGHGFAEFDGAADVVVVIRERVGFTLAHRLESGAMHHPGNRVGAKGPRQESAVAHVATYQWQRLTGQSLQARQHRGRTVGKVIHNDRRIACAGQRDDDVRADVARAASDKNRLCHVAILREQERFTTKPAEHKPGPLAKNPDEKSGVLLAAKV